MRLAAVLHDPEVLPAGEIGERLKVRHPAVEVDWNDPDGARRDPLLRVLRIETAVIVDVPEHGNGTRVQDPLDRRKRGHRRRENLVAGADPDRQESELDRGGPRRNRHGFADPDVRSELLFEGARLGAQDVPARLQDIEHGPRHLLGDRGPRERDHREGLPRGEACCSKGSRISRPVAIDS